MSDILPKYSFFPWLRQGISTKISSEDNYQDVLLDYIDIERAKIDLQVKIKGNGDDLTPIDTTANLVSPGDIIGLKPEAIIKSEPRNWITNFEPNYLPYVEFYDEDLPWRYTPAKAGADHRLRPWMFLVVLKEEEFTRAGTVGASLPVIEMADGTGPLSNVLPDSKDIWAWSHVQFNGDVDPTDSGVVDDAVTRLQTILADDPDLAYSRIICPRELEAGTDYYAFLIPTFETGRLAGLGIEDKYIKNVPAQTPAWGPTAVDWIESDDAGAPTVGIHNKLHGQFPVYHEFYFKTGSFGDFEYLVRQLVPRVMDPKVGRREIDVQDPEFLLNTPFGAGNGTLELEGALTVPGTTGLAYPWNASDLDADNYRDQLAALVNLGEDIKTATFADPGTGNQYASVVIGNETIVDDPIVAPPLYGRWHALQNRVVHDEFSPNHFWVEELNLDPRNRAVAGIGVSVIQKGQDLYMDMAWDQVGDVIDANKKLKWAQLSKEVVSTIFNKHVKPLPAEKQLAMTSKWQKRIKVGTKTIYKSGVDSVLPQATHNSAFRKIQRPNGPKMRKIDPSATINSTYGASSMISKMANDTLAAVDPKVISTKAVADLTFDVDGVISTSIAVDATAFPFVMTIPGDFATTTSTVESVAFSAALEAYKEQYDPINWLPEEVKPDLDVTAIKTEVEIKADPQTSIPARAYHSIKGVSELPSLPPADKIVPILAAPAFKQPMYEAVRDLSSELLIPNVQCIPQNTISLLQTNQRFIESYMVGLNHEMGRELLWREYPTDQRGTYFRQFWDTRDFVDMVPGGEAKDTLEKELYDIGFIHDWESNTDLGSHNNRVYANPDEEALVLVIRGDLLKKYPNAVIYAARAEWDKTGGVYDPNKPRLLTPDGEKYPMFGAKIDPDITFMGFDITATEANGEDPFTFTPPVGDPLAEPDPGYFFIIKERPGEPRFGADIPIAGTLNSWNDLNWDHIAVPAGKNYIDLTATLAPGSDITVPSGDATTVDVVWGNTTASTSVDMAQILYQVPVLVAVHASDMLDNV
jgi:hypothetical protein